MKALSDLITGTLTALFLLTLPAAVQAQFTFETNNGALTITGYTGPGGAVDIPSTTNGMPVTSIGSSAFFFQPTVASVTIPNSVANIGNSAFAQCYGLTNVVIGTNVTHIGIAAFWYCGLTSVTIPNNVTSIGGAAFYQCYSLTAIAVDALNSVYRSVDGVLFDKNQTKLIQYPIDKIGSDYTIPDGVISIEIQAFASCINLTSVTIPNGVTSIGIAAFEYCTRLTGVYFEGNAPGVGLDVFNNANNATVYYLPGTIGWGPTFGDRPTALWLPRVLTGDDSFGVRTNQFGFNISWASGMVVAVEACTHLANPPWSPLQTNTLIDGWSYFSDPHWTNYSARFYRLRWQWNPQVHASVGSVGVLTNRFGFTITGTSNLVVVVEACTNLVTTDWVTLTNITLPADTFYFTDREWTNYPARFYRLRWP